MIESIGLHVELGAGDYHHDAGDDLQGSISQAGGCVELVATFVNYDEHASISRPEFLARSWRIAMDKARELGWIG
jgi:hypothetical protein